MKLREYLEEEGIMITKFAKKLGISSQTLISIADGKGCSLNNAIKIEEATKGKVKCKDLLPEKKPFE